MFRVSSFEHSVIGIGDIGLIAPPLPALIARTLLRLCNNIALAFDASGMPPHRISTKLRSQLKRFLSGTVPVSKVRRVKLHVQYGEFHVMTCAMDRATRLTDRLLLIFDLN